MEKINLKTIGIGLLVVINLALAGYIFIGHRRHHHGRMEGHGRQFHSENIHARHHGRNHFGRSHDFGKERHGKHFMEKLNLTEEQKQKMETLRKEHHEKSEAFHNKLDELRKKESDLSKEGKLDATQINSIATEYGQIQKELHVLKLNHFAAINSILTKEQREEFSKKKEEFRKR